MTVLVAKRRVSVGSRASWPVRRLFDGGAVAGRRLRRRHEGKCRKSSITRHILGLFRAVPGARAFRRHLATEAVKTGADSTVLADALAFVLDRDTELAHIAA